MPHKVCRLCLSSDRLIYMFDTRLRTQDQLRACILLSTGVEIKESDDVTKFVCNSCCTIAVKLFKFRRNALANDKALKEYANQSFVEPLKNKEDIAKFNSTLTTDIEEAEIKPSKIIFDEPRCNFQETVNAVHPSVISLYKRYPTVIIPNELLRRNIYPLVALNKNETTDAMVHKVDEDDSDEFENNSEEINYFRKKLPGLNIVKVGLKTTPVLKTKDKIKQANVNKTKIGTNEVKKRQRANSESPEVMPQKKRRLFSKESKNIQKIDLPERSPKDIESKKIIFTSSLELTSLEKNSTPTIPSPEPTSSDNNSSPGIPSPELTFSEKNSAPKIPPPELTSSEKNSSSKIPSSRNFIKPSEICKESVTKSDTASSENENSFLEPLSNLTVVVCKTCSKIFLTKKQCKIHEKRVHRNCIICNRKHENQTNSFQHLPETCRKYVEVNQPNVLLIRADDVPEIVLKYADALSVEVDTFSVEEEDAQHSVEEENAHSVEEEGAHSVEKEEEDYETLENFGNDDEYLISVFSRHVNRVPRESRSVQSFEPDDVVRYELKGGLKLPNMYSDLLVYKVPVYLRVAQKMSASASYSFKPKDYSGTFSWEHLEAVDLINKTRNSLQEQKQNPDERIASKHLMNAAHNYLSKHIDRIIDINDKVLFTSSIKPRNGSVSETLDRLVMNKISSKQVVDENSVVNLLNFSAENAQPLTIPKNAFTTDACLNLEEHSSKTTDSNSNKCVLRVKAPWELNQCK